jgi:hypothetical protein
MVKFKWGHVLLVASQILLGSFLVVTHPINHYLVFLKTGKEHTQINILRTGHMPKRISTVN